MLEHQLTLLAFGVEHNQRLPLGQRLANAQHAGFQRRVVTVVGAVTGDEVFDLAGQGVYFELVVGDQHGRLGGASAKSGRY